MEALNKNWLTEGLLDFEYKKYILLAYMQKVKNHFNRTELYPPLSDLIWHYKNLLNIRDSYKNLSAGFKKDLERVDLKELKLIYSNEQQEEWIKEINDIINFAAPLFEKNIYQGKEIYDLIENHLSLNTVGIMPMNHNEGYFLFHYVKSKKVPVYYYSVSKIHTNDGIGRGIYTNYVGTYTLGINKTYETIKSQLIKSNTKIPVPAVYSIQSELLIPFKETLMPVAKRFFLRKANL